MRDNGDLRHYTHTMIMISGLMPHLYTMIDIMVARGPTYTMIEDGGLRPHLYIMIDIMVA